MTFAIQPRFSGPLLPPEPTTSFWPAETVGCVWWRESHALQLHSRNSIQICSSKSKTLKRKSSKQIVY
ncbi:hypothetical protein INR49_021764 [Caranx melampygus]|nr:hypothetical protein INR49_021764 [Caranx melampygus]